MPTIDLGKIKPIYKGDYNGATAYELLDFVRYNDSLYITKQATTGNLPTDTAYWDIITATSPDIAAAIHAATAKGTPVDDDELALVDSAASWGLKKLTWSSIKAALASLFVAKSGDTMTGPLSVPAGASGAQVPQAQEVVRTTGNQTVTGNKSFTGSVLAVGGGGIGYGVGSGGTANQGSGIGKGTTVILNKPSGQIAMDGAPLGAGETIGFVLTNSVITPSDIISINVTAASPNASVYRVVAQGGAGFAAIYLTNTGGSTLSDVLALQFNVHKGATS